MKTLDIWALFEKTGFFSRMRSRLKFSEKKNPEPKLSDYTYDQFIDHLLSEISELQEAIKEWDTDRLFKENLPYKLQKELCDVANMCGFVYAKVTKKETRE